MGRYTGKKCRLLSMFGLTFSFFLVEIVVGYVTNSMALVADSFHMLSDIAALIIAFLSVRMAPKSWDKNTYGWARAEVLGALINAVFLVALCFSITIESFKRFYEPEDIHSPDMILFVGTMGLVVNLFGLCLFHEHGSGHSHGSHSHLKDNTDDSYLNDEKNKKDTNHDSAQMNMRGVFLHVLADALGSVVVIVSALIMWLTDWEYKLYVDPGLSLLLVILMMHSVWPLLIESAMILLQTVPTHLDIENLKRKLLDEVEGILEIHDFHIWQLAGNRIIASAHIRCLNLSEYMKVAEKVKKFFHHQGIHSTTIQPEFVDTNNQSQDCALTCPKDTEKEESSCEKSKCCLPSKEDGDKLLIKASSLEDIPSVVTLGGPESNVSRLNDNQERSQITNALVEDDVISENTPFNPSSSNSKVIKIVSKQSNV